ncbi:MAG: site-specific DNA-methyltransferase [Deltaproteobacteria bacterium]|nr:site-specific DNA-methyltransferase [Deltaproteobacteria bacterium]
MDQNLLYYGDNLEVLKLHVKEDSVDLIYLDPPFKSNQKYNVLFTEQNGTRSKAQIKAFEDTWRWDEGSALAFRKIVETGGNVSKIMQAFYSFLGGCDMLAYLSMMAPRLLEMRRVLKQTGSIFLHCDPTASHYLKLLMDSIFKPENFKNEIIWHYRKWPSGKYAFQRNHDVILFYTKSESKERTFNQLYMDRALSTQKRFGSAKIISGYDETGRRIPSQTEERDSEGVRMDDVWDIGRVPPIKQLFPTQKPELLIERIIISSSKEGDLVLDPFCGCGTTIVTAQKLNRRWIGIDITALSITLIKNRLKDAFREEVPYKVIGEPVSLPDAEKLAREDPYQFQCWALGLVGARPVEQKKGADKGIDGRMYFHDEAKGAKTKQIIFSVKSGHTTVAQVRDLRGVLEREQAEIGILITLQPPTKPMKSEALEAGFYESPWGSRHPRLQILTIEELLAQKGVDLPVARVNVTFKKSDRVKENQVEYVTLPFE